MKPPVLDYVSPRSVDEVLAILADQGDSVKIIAGGQSLMPALNFRLSAPAMLVDLGNIEALRNVRKDTDALVLGAMVTHRSVEKDAAIRAALPLLAHGMEHVAHVQIRNRGTIGGSLCHADPSAEWPGLCLACDATMVIAGLQGIRQVPARKFVHGLFSTEVGPHDLLLEVRFPRWPDRRRWAFKEVSRRSGDFAIAGAAAVADFDATSACSFVRVAVFGATDKPELFELGASGARALTYDTAAAAIQAAARGLEVRGDHHASETYRAEIVQHVVATALRRIFAED